ncbi:MAG: 50S ribosomal protein L25 [candidate division Zixibacteria bacterium]|nr:50S ribosomal protein L25 [candidate division Zixibacteria bacterium]
MQEIKLMAETREGVGKERSRKLRRTGVVPGILYGPETKPLPLVVKSGELSGLIRHHGRTNMLIDLGLNNETATCKVIIRELQRDPVSGQYCHIDFYQVSMKKKLHLSALVHLTGLASGVKNSGGIMEHVTREIEIACLPSDIPEKIEIDISALEIGDSIHVRDLKVDKVDILTDLGQTIATVVPPTIIKTETVAAPTAEEAAAAEEAGKLAEGETAEGETKAEGEGAKKTEGEGAKKAEHEVKAAKPGKEAKGKK